MYNSTFFFSPVNPLSRGYFYRDTAQNVPTFLVAAHCSFCLECKYHFDKSDCIIDPDLKRFWVSLRLSSDEDQKIKSYLHSRERGDSVIQSVLLTPSTC